MGGRAHLREGTGGKEEGAEEAEEAEEEEEVEDDDCAPKSVTQLIRSRADDDACDDNDD